jgi:hypothetical protein
VKHTDKTMRGYIDNIWVHAQGGYWIAKAIAFSENGNDVTITACHHTPEPAYKTLVTGMKELGLGPSGRISGSAKGRRIRQPRPSSYRRRQPLGAISSSFVPALPSSKKELQIPRGCYDDISRHPHQPH